jgi:hypothetical protein
MHLDHDIEMELQMASLLETPKLNVSSGRRLMAIYMAIYKESK